MACYILTWERETEREREKGQEEGRENEEGRRGRKNSFFCLFVCFWWNWGFELRVSHLPSRCSTA
jgi:hypothetical protein